MLWSKLVCAFALTAVVAGCDGGSNTPVDASFSQRPDGAILMIAPVLNSFTATPSAAPPGMATSITWRWSYEGLPTPVPTCSIDQGVGAVMIGDTTVVTIPGVTVFTLSCTNSAGTGTRQVVVGGGPAVAPDILSFTATPDVLTSGVATDVTWTWTHYSTPNPMPSCSVTPNVGVVTNGQTTSVTITSSTTFTLTCTSVAGTRTRTDFVSAVVPPTIATFTANPATVPANTSTTVVFSWTYAAPPTPSPSCTLDGSFISNGGSRTVNIAADTQYTLACTSSAGTDSEVVTVTTP